MTYIQFRLSNGDELICQVVEEPEEDETNVIIRNAMMIHKVETTEGSRYHTFRPWMAGQISDQYFQMLNYTHIVGEAKPEILLLEQYHKALKRELMNDAEFKELMAAKYNEIVERLSELAEQDEDSDQPANVFKLFDRDKMH
tara:strand:+ start:1000 stop:1425 length:426 start_codon:yes stop_codon:yes gene_type:complete